MTPAAFTSWRLSLSLSVDAAAEALGISRSTIQRYEAGTLPIPVSVALATRYLSILYLINH